MTMTKERAIQIIEQAKSSTAGTRRLWQDQLTKIMTIEEENFVNRVWGNLSLGNRSSSFVSAILAIAEGHRSATQMAAN